MNENLENKANEEFKKLKVGIGLSILFIGYVSYSDKINEAYNSVNEYIIERIPSMNTIILDYKYVNNKELKYVNNKDKEEYVKTQHTKKDTNEGLSNAE